MEEKQVILSVEHLMISFSQYVGGWRQRELPVIRDLNIKVREHEVVAVAGSSGSGKSLLAHAVMGLLPQNAACQGTVSFEGEILTQEEKGTASGEPDGIGPPERVVSGSAYEGGRTGTKGTKRQGEREALPPIHGALRLGEDTEELYPFELSGGMTRRVLISTAVMEHPRLVIADEPTPGLHISAARRVLSHFREIADQGAGVLLITHDLELALEVADRIVVFYAGTNVEEALAEDFEDEQRLRHPYTKALFRAMPRHGFKAASGTQPYAADMPAGCPYGPRCPDMDEGCLQEISYRSFRGGMVKCRKAGI